MITKHFFKIVFVLIFIFLFSPFLKVSASELCSPNGYTVLFVDNTFTNEDGAVIIKNKLAGKLPETLNGQKIIVDYLYSPKSDYIKMLDDVSKKVATQKLLFVAFQQDNLSVNNFYNKITSQPGGVPKESVSVYSMDASTTRNNIIVSLDKLKNNDEQENEELCIDPPEFSIFYKIKNTLSAYAIFVVDNIKKAVIYIANGVHNVAVAIGNSVHNVGIALGNVFTNLLANAVKSLPDAGNTTTFPGINISEPVKDGPSQKTSVEQKAPTIKDVVVPMSPTEASESVGKNTANDVLPPIAPVAPVVSNVVHHGGGHHRSSPVKDTTPPVISIIGANLIDVIKDTVYTDAGATASDNADGDITANIIVVNPVDINTVGAYIITYNISDSAGNNATEVIRTVNVNAPPIPLSSAKTITAFNFASLVPEVDGVVNETDHTISLTVPFGINATALVPTIIITGTSISPASDIAQDFTNPVTYTVTAEDSSTQDYIATVLIAPDPNPPLDTTPPTILLFYPADDATNISVNVQPTLTFSEALNLTTINGENIELREYAAAAADAKKVPTALTYSVGNIVTFILSSPLEHNKQYYFFVGTGVKDISGNSFAASTWYHTQRANHEFTTEAMPPL